MKKQLTFIASGGRTGTQFFGDVLGQLVSDCHSEHEPDMVAGLSRLTLDRIRRFGAWHMGPGRILGQTGVRVIGQSYLEGRIDFETCAERLRATRDAYHASIDQSLIVESYYAWWMLADRIGEIWPDAKLVGVLRDPRDWIASWLRHEPGRRKGALTERLPPGPFEPQKIGDVEAAAIWPDLDQLGRLAWEWSLIANTLDRAADGSDNVEIFRFEDLFGSDHSVLRRFAEIVSSHAQGPTHEIGDVAEVAGLVSNASFGPKLRWVDWSDEQIASVVHFCGPGMARHGYGDEPEWRERVASVAPI